MKKKKPTLKIYRELAREYASKRGVELPFMLFGVQYTLRDLVKAFKRNPHWIKYKNKTWSLNEKYFFEFKKDE